jgi:hypothetical protein
MIAGTRSRATVLSSMSEAAMMTLPMRQFAVS